MANRGKIGTTPIAKCRICGKYGVIGNEIAYTGNGYAVHFGDCHRKIIAVEKTKIAKIEKQPSK